SSWDCRSSGVGSGWPFIDSASQQTNIMYFIPAPFVAFCSLLRPADARAQAGSTQCAVIEERKLSPTGASDARSVGPLGGRPGGKHVQRKRVLVLGAGFGGLEVSSRLSERFGADIDLVLIDQADS